MPDDAISLQIDRVTKALIGLNTTLPPLHHPYAEQFHIQIVEVSDALNEDPTYPDYSGSTLKMILCSKPNAIPTGSDGAPTIYAQADADAWTWDAVNSRFSGGLELNTAPLRTKIREKSSVDLYLYILLTTDGVEKVIFGPTSGNANVQIAATAASSTATAEADLPAAEYYNKTEADARFVRSNDPDANYKFIDGQFCLWDIGINAYRPAGFNNGQLYAGDPLP